MGKVRGEIVGNIVSSIMTGASSAMESAAQYVGSGQLRSDINEAGKSLGESFKGLTGYIHEQLKSDSTKAQESFTGIKELIESGAPYDQEKIDKIQGFKDRSKDSALQVFADAALGVMGLDDATGVDKAGVLTSLKDNFGFIAQDDYKSKTKDELAGLITKATALTMESEPAKKSPDAVAAIDSSLKTNFSQVTQQIENTVDAQQQVLPTPTTTTDLSPTNVEANAPTTKAGEEKEKSTSSPFKEKEFDATGTAIEGAKGAAALVTVLLLPPPLNAIAALGFIAYYMTQDEKAESKKTGFDAEKYADYWKEYAAKMEEQSKPRAQGGGGLDSEKEHGEITEEDREKTKRSVTITGKAAGELVTTEEEELEKQQEQLRTTEAALIRADKQVTTVTKEKAVDATLTPIIDLKQPLPTILEEDEEELDHEEEEIDRKDVKDVTDEIPDLAKEEAKKIASNLVGSVIQSSLTGLASKGVDLANNGMGNEGRS